MAKPHDSLVLKRALDDKTGIVASASVSVFENLKYQNTGFIPNLSLLLTENSNQNQSSVSQFMILSEYI